MRNLPLPLLALGVIGCGGSGSGSTSARSPFTGDWAVPQSNIAMAILTNGYFTATTPHVVAGGGASLRNDGEAGAVPAEQPMVPVRRGRTREAERRRAERGGNHLP